MKLISFAIVSLLAITVSAWPHRSTATQSKHQSAQYNARTELRRLIKLYKNDITTLRQVRVTIRMLERETMSVEQMAGMIKAQLQNTDLSSEEKLELENQRSDVEAALAELYRKRDEQNQLDMDTKKALDKSKTEAQLLRENQKWLAKYNFYHEVKIGPSPNSFYNLNTLENYYKTILQKIDTLLDKQKKIVELLGGQKMFNSRTPLAYMYSLENELKKIGDRILVLESYTKVAKRILEEGGVPVAN
ncbi:hypothetical protein BASA84_001236 [Batrachochytrium salamandrivorans]|nr:hypothetical protein BASA84_001236 [Batrachochytrium salamandrivorans]